MNILLLEDDQALNRVITKILTLDKHIVTSTHNGRELLDIIEKPFDLYILDINVPHINGLQLLEKLQKCFDVEVIIMSANSDVDSINKAYALGAKEYLQKPFQIKELRDMIDKLFV